MTGPEHYQEAEALLDSASATESVERAAGWRAEALVHAVLAQAAATALNDGEHGLRRPDYDAWREVAGEKQAAGAGA